MKTVRKYQLRAQAENAASFLMSKGIATTIYGNDRVPTELQKFQPEAIELAVQDQNLTRANEFLTQRESGGVNITLPKLDFSIPWKKKNP